MNDIGSPIVEMREHILEAFKLGCGQRISREVLNHVITSRRPMAESGSKRFDPDPKELIADGE